jgi:hypothetical protein
LRARRRRGLAGGGTAVCAPALELSMDTSAL